MNKFFKRRFECGSFTVAGPLKGKAGICGHKRLMCQWLRCTICQKRRLHENRARIAALADEHRLTQFVTLTLDTKKIGNPEESARYIKNCWRKMRVVLRRHFGSSIPFIAVLEFQKSGFAHLHILVSVLIQQAWLSEAWQSIGGGKIVDVRTVDVHRVSAYLTSYLVGSKIEHTLLRLPLRSRIFLTSRGLSLSGKGRKAEWWLIRRGIETVRNFCSNPANERYTDLGARSSLLTYFEGLPSTASVGDLDIFAVLKRLIRAVHPQQLPLFAEA
jgi:hypothetical protein